MEGVFRAIRDSGFRATAGKCLMDSGEGIPGELLQDTRTALAGAEEMARSWDGEARGRIRAALCPRFVLSGSRELWEGVAALAETLNAPIHTHLLESEAEEKAVHDALGQGQMEFLDETGILDRDLRIAHGVLLGDPHSRILAGRPLSVIHCPSANAKLGSGIADLVFLRDQENISVGIGCDGAACNNDLDVLEEIRLAALLQGIKQGAGRFTAREALELATIEGARAMGMEGELGSIETGKAGDLVVMNLEGPRTLAHEEVSIYARIVYGAGRDSVRWVVVDGEVLVESGTLPHLDEDALKRRSKEETDRLLSRARLP
jgi:cytosine/adenosine deaminase-related metal-dependent hydrolase